MNQSNAGAVASNDQLGPLPEPHDPPVFGYTSADMRAYALRERAAERDPANVVFRALLLAAWDAPGTRTAGEMRSAAVTLFGAAAVDAALARIRA